MSGETRTIPVVTMTRRGAQKGQRAHDPAEVALVVLVMMVMVQGLGVYIRSTERGDKTIPTAFVSIISVRTSTTQPPWPVPQTTARKTRLLS